MESNQHQLNRSDLNDRITHLTSRLENEMLKVNLSHQADLQLLASDCNQAMTKFTSFFDDRLREIQRTYQEKVLAINEEIAYLRELSTSQRLMLENSMEHIKELERRYGSSQTP